MDNESDVIEVKAFVLEKTIKFPKNYSSYEDIIKSLKSIKVLNPKISYNFIFIGNHENLLLGENQFEEIRDEILSDSFKRDKNYFIIQEDLNAINRSSYIFETSEKQLSDNFYDLANNPNSFTMQKSIESKKSKIQESKVVNRFNDIKEVSSEASSVSKAKEVDKNKNDKSFSFSETKSILIPQEHGINSKNSSSSKTLSSNPSSNKSEKSGSTLDGLLNVRAGHHENTKERGGGSSSQQNFLLNQYNPDGIVTNLQTSQYESIQDSKSEQKVQHLNNFQPKDNYQKKIKDKMKNTELEKQEYEQNIQVSKDIFEQAIQFESKGYKNNAIESYNLAISLNPNFSLAYYSLGKIYKTEGNFSDAIFYLKKAIELDSNNSNAYNHLGIIYRKQKKDPEAEYNY